MKKLCVIGFAFVALLANAEGQFKPSSLIVPQGVSYRFSPVRLTRDVQITSGTFDRNTTAENTESNSSWDNGSRLSSSAKSSSHDDSVTKNIGASASAGFSILNPLDIHAEAHAKIDDDVIDLCHKDNSLVESNRSETASTSKRRSADTVVENAKGTLGNYYLVFTMTLKNLDLNDTYVIKPPADGELRAIVEGLSDQFEVPCVSAKSFTLDIGDERLCRFALKIVDERLLSELKGLKTLSGVKPKINGSIFPIISEETNRNVLKEQKRAQLLNPTTEISLSFGKASMMSPWKVKRSYGKDSGRNGQKVTLRDALKAINEYVAAGDAMPEHVFEFNAEEALWRVSEREFGKVGKADEGLLGMNVGECLNGSLSLEKVGKDILDRPISEFPSIAFDEVNPKKVAEMYAGGDQKMNEPFHAMIKVLKNAVEDDDIQHLIAYVLTQSPEAKEREQAAGLLKKLFQAKNDVNAATLLVQMYFRHPKTCTYKNDLPQYVSFLIRNDEDWVRCNAESDTVEFIQDTLIKDDNVPTLLAFLDDPRFEATTNGFTVLMRIAKSGNEKVASGVLKAKKLDVNFGNGELGTALEWAAMHNHVGMCKLLVDNGANPNKCYGDRDKYCTAVDMAAGHDAVESLKYLLDEALGDIHIAQFCAAKGAAAKAIRYLVEVKGVDTNRGTYNGFRFMNYAAWFCDYATYDWLIDHGVVYDWDAKKEGVERPMTSACRRGNLPVVDLLIAKGVKIEYDDLGRLLNHGKLDWIQDGVRKKKIDRELALLVSIGVDDVQAVTALLNRTEVNGSTGAYNWFPLSWAANCNSTNVAHALVRMGANVNGKIDNGRSPLQQACKAGALEMVKYLYEDCHAILDDAIFHALKANQKGVLEYFLSLRGEDGLLQFPVDTYSHGAEGSLLMVAVEMGSVEMFDYLIRKGANVKHAPKGKCSIMEYVMRRDAVEILKYLVDQKGVEASREVLDAARWGSMNCLKYMIENKRFDANYLGPNKEDGFLLGEAAMKGQTEVCKYLISKGADVMCKPIYEKGLFSKSYHKTALEWAEQEGHTETANYLRSVLQEKLNTLSPAK